MLVDGWVMCLTAAWHGVLTASYGASQSEWGWAVLERMTSVPSWLVTVPIHAIGGAHWTPLDTHSITKDISRVRVLVM